MSETENTHVLGGGAAAAQPAAQALAVSLAAQVLTVREIAERVAVGLASPEVFRLAATSQGLRAALQAALRPRLVHRVAQGIAPPGLPFPAWGPGNLQALTNDWTGAVSWAPPHRGDTLQIQVCRDRFMVRRVRMSFTTDLDEGNTWVATTENTFVSPQTYASGTITRGAGGVVAYRSHEELAALLAPFFEGGPRPPA